MAFEIILKYFPDLSPEQTHQFRQLLPLYEEWNAKINVISRKDMDHFYERHVLHSLGLAKVHTFQPHNNVLDVGTGGGFPGIPLSILFPQTQFHLVDSIGKKITVVESVVSSLNLKNVKAEKARAEDLEEKYDFVISRAVTRLLPFYYWVKNKIKSGKKPFETGILYLKGGELKEELDELKTRKEVFELKAHFEEEFFDTKKVVYVPF